MNSKSASATATVVAALIVVILSVAVGIADGSFASKETRYASLSKRVIGSSGGTESTESNIVEEFSGEWYDVFFNNQGGSVPINEDTECYREKYDIDPVTGSLVITEKTYSASMSGNPKITVETYVKVNDDPKTNTEWKDVQAGAILKLQKITKEFAVYTITYEKNEVYLNVMTKNAVITEEQLEEAKKIAKENHYKGDELSRKYNTHCDKLPPP